MLQYAVSHRSQVYDAIKHQCAGLNPYEPATIESLMWMEGFAAAYVDDSIIRNANPNTIPAPKLCGYQTGANQVRLTNFAYVVQP